MFDWTPLIMCEWSYEDVMSTTTWSPYQGGLLLLLLLLPHAPTSGSRSEESALNKGSKNSDGLIDKVCCCGKKSTEEMGGLCHSDPKARKCN